MPFHLRVSFFDLANLPNRKSERCNRPYCFVAKQCKSHTPPLVASILVGNLGLEPRTIRL